MVGPVQGANQMYSASSWGSASEPAKLEALFCRMIEPTIIGDKKGLVQIMPCVLLV